MQRTQCENGDLGQKRGSETWNNKRNEPSKRSPRATFQESRQRKSRKTRSHDDLFSWTIVFVGPRAREGFDLIEMKMMHFGRHVHMDTI